MFNILVIDDEKGVRDMLAYELGAAGYLVRSAASGEEGLRSIAAERFHLVLSDLRMAGLGGLDVIDAIKRHDPDIEVVLATGHATVETAVSAVKRGAFEVLQKPFDLEELHSVVSRALEKRDLKAELAMYKASRALFSQVRLESLLPTLVDLSAYVLGADRVSLLLVDPDGDLRMRASRGFETAAAGGDTASLKAHVAALREPAVVDGPLASDPRFEGLPSSPNVRSSLVCPLSARSELLGVWCASRTKGVSFDPADIRRATIFCQQVGQAVENARLYEALEQKARAAEEAYRRLEESRASLLQSEKMALVGTLAAGIAHEMATPLTGMLGYLKLLGEQVKDQPATVADLRRIEEETLKVSDMARDLLDYARPAAFRLQEVSLVEVLEASLDLLKFHLRKLDVQVERRFEPGAPNVVGDRGRLRQLFLNLIVNAVHAMENAPVRKLTLGLRRSESAVVAEISDTGPGIPAALRDRIFEPFFTTKDGGKGTGLGLFIVHGIVEQHGGRVEALDGEGRGAKLRVELPAAL